MIYDVNLNQKEAKKLKLTLKKKSDGTIFNPSTATCTFYCKDALDSSTTYKFTVQDASFDKSQGASGILRIQLTSDNLDWYGEKYGILKMYFSSTNIVKLIFKLIVTQSPE